MSVIRTLPLLTARKDVEQRRKNDLLALCYDARRTPERPSQPPRFDPAETFAAHLRDRGHVVTTFAVNQPRRYLQGCSCVSAQELGLVHAEVPG